MQIAAAQQDSMLQQQYAIGMSVNPMIGTGVPLEMVLMPAPPPPPSIQPIDLTKTEPVTPEEIVKRMRTKWRIFLYKSYIFCELLYTKKESSRRPHFFLFYLIAYYYLEGWAVWKRCTESICRTRRTWSGNWSKSGKNWSRAKHARRITRTASDITKSCVGMSLTW